MKRIIVLALLLNSCLLFGQTKKDSLQIQFSEKSGKLKKATGWGYRYSSDEWIDYPNVICNRHDYKRQYRSEQGSDYMYSQYKQNFDSIETKRITKDSLTYYVLIIHKTTGLYKYPNMKIDWYTFKESLGYIFSEEEFSKLDSITEPVELTTKYVVSMGSSRIVYNQNIFQGSIIRELNFEKSKIAPDYIFPVLKSEEGNIHFLTPEHFTKTKNYNFKEAFFEVSLENFEKLLFKE